MHVAVCQCTVCACSCQFLYCVHVPVVEVCRSLPLLNHFVLFSFQDIATNQKVLLELAADHQGDTWPLGSSEETSSSKMDKKEERRKKAAGQSSTSKQGMQGREKKTQKVKEKGGRSSRHHHDEDPEEGGYSVGKSLQFMSTEDVSDCIGQVL